MTYAGDGDGFADPRVFLADRGRDGGASILGASPSFSFDDAIVMHTDGCSLGGKRGPGGWAYVMHEDGLASRVQRSGGLQNTTNNRAELWAVINALESIEEPSSVRLHTDSKYVFDGITKYLPGWILHGWTSSSGGRRQPLKNADLWKRLRIQLQRHAVVLKWVRSHSGITGNELCDRLAHQAAESVL
jgi:ribonuclease HI